MQGNIWLPLAAFLPLLCAPLAYALGRKGWQRAIFTMIATSAASLLIAIAVLIAAAGGEEYTFVWAGFSSLGLSLRADGFRALYVCVASVMWLVTSVFSRDYFAHEHHIPRYAFFTLMTLGATLGLFYSDNLFSAFIFFEVMSLASYPWVAQEETPEAMRAAQTYLYIAVIGGLVMLMGLFMLPAGGATVPYAGLRDYAATVGTDALWLPAVLILIGFGAKAGAFPLHIWLPKAHPVAPAPASALLSGMLTKAGVLGMLVLTCGLMNGAAEWADLLFRLGVITMVLGALLALFSVNLKRTLACSSLSQIGFIMIGIGMIGLLGEENGLAAYGTVQHMVNHSLFKLILFTCAGVVAMNTGKLALDDVRGFGRHKPVLHFAFLMGLLGIAGVPLFSGFASKSLLHEGILEYIAHLEHLGLDAGAYRIGESAFLFSGGMTLCYMLKLYICLFWQKHPTDQAAFEQKKQYLSKPSAIALTCAACIVPILGVFPGVFMSGVGGLSQSFLNAAAPAHSPIHYFSVENLQGAATSIGIGLILYILLRIWLTDRAADGSVQYLNRWPKWLDLEEVVYRPLLKTLIALGYGVAFLIDRVVDWIIFALKAIGLFVGRLMDSSGDGLGMAARQTVLSPRKAKMPVPVGNRLTYLLGRFLDGIVAILNRTVRHADPIQTSFVTSLAAGQEEFSTEFKRLTRSISFGLLMFCLGLYVTLAYLLQSLQ